MIKFLIIHVYFLILIIGIPFSAGTRVCIGNNFSLLEQKIFLVGLLKNFEFKLENENEIIESMPNSILFTPKKLNIVFKEIKN
jgi:cytochrome P450